MPAPMPTHWDIEKLQGHAAMMVFSALVAGSNSLGKLIANDIDPAALTAVRFMLAAVLLAAAMAASGGLKRRYFQAPWRYLPLGAAYAGFFVLMFHALQRTNPVSTSAIFTMMPFFAALMAWGFFGKNSSGLVWAALVLGAFGALWVVFGGSAQALGAWHLGTGEMLFMLGTASHAAYAVMVPYLRRTEPVAAVTLGVAMSGALILLVLYWPQIWATDWHALPMRVWAVLIYLAVFAGIGTFSLITLAAERLSPAKVTAYTYLTPVWVVIIEMAMGHAIPQPMVLLGGLPIVAALLLLFFEPPSAGAAARRPRPKRP